MARQKHKCILLSERSQSEKTTYYIIPNTTFWKRQNYGDSKKRSVVARGWGEGGMNRQSTEDFQGSGTPPYDTVRLDTSLCICPNP